MDLYADTVKRICVLYLKNHADTEDIFQTVFLKYTLRSAAFESPEHEKAWFIRVTINACKDLLRSFFRRRTVPLEEAAAQAAVPEEDGAVLEAVLALPECDLPPLLRAVHRAGDRRDPGEEPQHGVHPAGPGTGAAEKSAGRGWRWSVRSEGPSGPSTPRRR